METTLPVKPYTYFRLHTNTSVDPLNPPRVRIPWNTPPPQNSWGDKDHFFGRIKTYSIKKGEIAVILEILVQAQWNDERAFRWQPLRRFENYTMVFEHCISRGEDDKSRRRFKSAATNELIILSHDDLDGKITEELIKELSPDET